METNGNKKVISALQRIPDTSIQGYNIMVGTYVMEKCIDTLGFSLAL